MRSLLNECIPTPLKRYLEPHEIATVSEKGWCGAKNGQLLRLAGELSKLPIAVVLLTVPNNSIESIPPLVEKAKAAIEKIRAKELVIVS